MSEFDPVHRPAHYNQGGIECIDAIAAATANLTGIVEGDTHFPALGPEWREVRERRSETAPLIFKTLERI